MPERLSSPPNFRRSRLRAVALRAVTGAAAVCVVSIACGCSKEDAIDRFSTCEWRAVESVRQKHDSASVECDLGENVWLVGVPAVTPKADALVAAGLPAFAALSISKQQGRTSMWCAVIEVAPAEPPPHTKADPDYYRQFDTHCVPAQTPIPTFSVTRATRVLVTARLVPGNRGSDSVVTVASAR